MMKHNVLYIYTDGSYFPKDMCGGWAALLWFNCREKLVSGSGVAYGAHEMEIKAAVAGLSAMNPNYKGQIVVVSDSRYMIDRMNMRCTISPDDHDLFAPLTWFQRTYSISWEWVRGHDTHPQNRRVDFIARGEAIALAKQKVTT